MMILTAVLFFASAAPGLSYAADSSGLQLDVYLDQEHPDYRYTLGEPVYVLLVIKNISGWPLNTDQGFSQVDLRKALIVTDAAGTRHACTEETEAGDPLPPFFINRRPSTAAEVLPAKWVRSAVVQDIRELFPFMTTTPGWYQIEAQQPFIRFAWIIQAEGLGDMGVLDDPDNWHGTVNADKIEINIVPPMGAGIAVRVLDGAGETDLPLAQVPVRLFKTADISQGAATVDTWHNVKPLLTGVTDFAGWTTWQDNKPCLPEADYTAIGYYADQYESTGIATGTGHGWAEGCGGLVASAIVFGEAIQVLPGDLNSDGCVDRTDYNLLMACVRGLGPCDPAYDLNEDGAVNRADLRTLLGLFTNPNGAACQ